MFPGGEELAIHDFEAPFKVEEYDNIEELNEIAEQIEDLDEYDQQKLVYLMDDGCNFKQALNGLDDCDFYPDTTLEDVAYNLVEEGCFGSIPKSIQNYIDYEAIARDLSFDGYHETNAGVFRRG